MDYCAMPLDPVLESIKQKIVTHVNRTWDTDYLGEQKEYKILPVRVYDTLTIGILSYPVTSKWVAYTSTTSVSDLEQAFEDIVPKFMSPINIQGTAEGGYDFYLAMSDLRDSLEQISKLAKEKQVVLKLAKSSGLDSKHVYIEFEKQLDDVTQNLILVLVVKNSKA